ncbi:hypothetical protein [Tahibacter caeni]|uniref:hypothetical protein n=1 Tax=Tahibacter caeni TaxID=1453545 RepID=UPI002147927B|nr:hypothetical protein [Tahibacter caeni]
MIEVERNGIRRGLPRVAKPALRSLALATALWSLPGLACGPYFPHELLTDRHASVYDLVEGTFDFEATQLVPRPAAVFKPNENPWEAPGESRDTLEKEELGEDGWAKAQAMREAADDASAWAAGEGLPQDVRLYLAGARAFHAGEADVARRRFEAVLALSADQQNRRGVWAHFMLGRLRLAYDVHYDPDQLAAIAAGRGAADPAVVAMDTIVQAAAADFQAVRTAVAAGAADPLGLAVASYGEEAQLHLARDETVAAVKLYAEQAAQGSASGRASLLFVARGLFADEARLQKALADPLLQRLLAAYVYTRSNELIYASGEEQENSGDAAADAAQSAAAAAAGTAMLERYYAAVAASTGEIAGVDRVAAAAYRAGRYELAAKLAPRSETAMAWWVRAKLALRDGDDKAAAEAYAKASQAFPRNEDWGLVLHEGYETDGLLPACRVDGERAILALSRGDYTEALALFRASDSWVDQAHVAERVLSVDELKQFVDARVPAPATAAKPDENGWVQRSPDEQLRALLGRRLLRLGRYDEAVAYFPPDLRGKAADYAKARADAAKLKSVERADALFRAATLARESGMELLGFELAPDAAVFDGAYEWSEPELDKQDKKLVGADEIQRSTANQAQPAQRFHYRFVAADLAGQAADLVPARSQAFAALLCNATGWVINGDANLAQRYYRRYVADGPYVAWAANFGTSGYACPAPDFAGAAKRLQFERLRWAKQTLRRAAPFVAAGVGALALGGVLLLLRRRRTKAAR